MSSTRELRVVLLGKTGSGKSSLGNTLLGYNAFTVENSSFSSVTWRCQWEAATRNDVALKLTDTPGICDTNRSEEEVLREVGKSVAVASPGPHVVLMVLKCGRFTKEENQAYVTLKTLFGENIKKFMMIVFTNLDQMEGNTAQEQWESLRTALSGAPAELQVVLHDAGSRYFAVNNRALQPERESQARQLLAMMQELVSQNEGAYFTNELCADISSRVDELVQRCVEREHVTPELAATVTRQAIVRDQEDPGFFQAILPIVKIILAPAFGAVAVRVAGMAVKAIGARLAACSVM